MNKQVQTFGPYSAIRKAGETYYVSGQVGMNPDTKAADSDVTAQAHQALKNLGNVLRSVGLTYENVAKTTLYLTDMSTFTQVNEVYLQYFNDPKPARTTVGVAELPHVGGSVALMFELDAVAVRNTA